MSKIVAIKIKGETLEEVIAKGDIELENMSSEETLQKVLNTLKSIQASMGPTNSLRSSAAKKMLEGAKEAKAEKVKKERPEKDPAAAINHLMSATQGELKILRSILDGAKDPVWAQKMMRKFETSGDIRPLLKEVTGNLKKQGIASGKSDLQNIVNHKKLLSDLRASHQNLISIFPKMMQPFIGKVLNITDMARGRGIVGGVEAILSQLPPHLMKFGIIAGILTKTLYESVQALVKWNSTIFKTSEVGASFSNNLIEMRVSAARAGMSLDEFSALISKSSAVFANYGLTVTDGIKVFTNLSNTVLKKYGNELAGMGINMEQLNEAMPIFLDLNRAVSDKSKITVDQQAASFKNLMMETDLMAKLTGKSRQALLGEIQKKQQDIAVQLKLSKMTTEQKAKFDQTMIRMTAQFGDTGGEMVKLRLLGVGPITEKMRIATSIMPGMADAINAATDASQNQAISTEEFNDVLDTASLTAKASAIEAAKSAEGVVAAGAAGIGGAAGMIGEILTEVVGINSKNLSDTKEMADKKGKETFASARAEQKARDEMKGGIDSVTTQFKIMTAELWTAFKPIYIAVAPLFIRLAKVLVLVLEGVTAIASGFSSITKDIGTLGLVGVLALFGIAIAASLGALKVFSAAVFGVGKGLLSKLPGVGKMFGGASAAGSSTGGIAGGIGKGVSSVGGGLGAGISSLGKGIGTFMSGIGKGAGAAISGVLRGLGTGLSALGTPKVLLGIVNMGLLGLAIIPFSYALKQFTGIDWTSVMKAGASLGVLAVAAGIMGIPAFAVPIAIGAGVIALLGVALIPFAYAANLAAPAMDNIITSLARAKDLSLSTIMGIGPALVGMSLGMAALTAGGLLTNVIDGLGSLFGAKSPFEKLNELGKAGPGIATIAGSLAAINEALNAMPNGEKLHGIVSNINSIDTTKMLLLTASTLLKNKKETNSSPEVVNDGLSNTLKNLTTVLETLVVTRGGDGQNTTDSNKQQLALLDRIDRTLGDIKKINADGFDSLS